MQTGALPIIEARPELRAAVAAAQGRKAVGITVLDLSGLGAFTEAFAICTAFSTRQVQAVSDAIEEALDRAGCRLLHREGYDRAEWVLLDYGRYVIHIFLERARLFYDIERLWRQAPRLDVPDMPLEKSLPQEQEAESAPRDEAASA